MFTPWVFDPYSGQGLSFNIRDTPSTTTLRRIKENSHYVSFQVALSHVFGEVICRDVNLLAFHSRYIYPIIVIEIDNHFSFGIRKKQINDVLIEFRANTDDTRLWMIMDGTCFDGRFDH